MHATFAIGSALISSSLAAVVAPSAVAPTSPALITPGPRIELLRKQNNDRFMGYVELLPGTWSSIQCNAGNTLYQTGNYWACCTTTRAGCANMPIGCVSGNMIYSTLGTASGQSNGLLTRACTSIWTATEDYSYSICNTGSLFQNSLDSSPKTNIFCGAASSNWSYYRQQPATSAKTTSVPTSPASTTPAIPAPTAPIIVTPSPEPEKEESKAWIAGAVIGPIVGLALIGLGVFFFLRRKKNKSAGSNVAPATGSVGPTPGAYQQNSTHLSDPNQPPGYYPPMQQNAGAPGFVPAGVQKHDGYYGQPQSPISQGSMSPNPQSQYGQQQQWNQPGTHSVYGAPSQGVPSPSMSPAPQHVQPAPYIAEANHFSSELEGSTTHAIPELVAVQPKTN